jgi:hypothetical protein
MEYQGWVVPVVLGLVILIAWRFFRRPNGFPIMAEARGWKYTQNPVSDGYLQSSQSILLHSLECTVADLVQGSVGSEKFEFVNIIFAREIQDVTEFYGVFSMPLTGKSPHLLVLPDRQGFLSPIEIRNELDLKPAELAGGHVKVYAPENYEIEALQILQPDVLERLRQLKLIVEVTPVAVNVITKSLNSQEMESLLPQAMMLAGLMKGIRSVGQIGDESPILQRSKWGSAWMGSRWFVWFLVIWVAVLSLSMLAGYLWWLTR